MNENWKKEWSSPVYVEKMQVIQDSIIDPFSDLSQGEILSKLKEDSLSGWYANANVSDRKEAIYRSKKIYFTKDNGFPWKNNITGKETSVFGRLETNTWYRFAGLVSYAYWVYVYVDSSRRLHHFNVNLANY